MTNSSTDLYFDVEAAVHQSRRPPLSRSTESRIIAVRFLAGILLLGSGVLKVVHLARVPAAVPTAHRVPGALPVLIALETFLGLWLISGADGRRVSFWSVLLMMIRRAVGRSLLLWVASVIAGPLFCGGHAGAADMDGRLARLLGQYRLVRTVDTRALVAETQIPSVYMPVATKPITGTISWLYKAMGRSYFLKCVPASGWIQRGNALAIAYNGTQYEFFDIDAGNLGYRRKDMWATNTLAQNPFFYPVEFLDPTNQKHPGRDVKLWYAQSRAVLRRLVSSTSWESRAPAGYSAVADIPGVGRWYSHRFMYRVLFGREIDYLPRTIELVYGRKNEISWRYDIAAYRTVPIGGKPFYYAKSALIRGYLHGKLYLTQRVSVRSCRLNVPLPASAFTIDFGLADRVFNIATGRIVYDRFASPKDHKLIIGVKRFKEPLPGKPASKTPAHGPVARSGGSGIPAPVAVASAPQTISETRSVVLAVVFAGLALLSGGAVFVLRRRSRLQRR